MITNVLAAFGLVSLALALIVLIRNISDFYIETKDIIRVVENKLSSNKELMMIRTEGVDSRLREMGQLLDRKCDLLDVMNNADAELELKLRDLEDDVILIKRHLDVSKRKKK